MNLLPLLTIVNILVCIFCVFAETEIELSQLTYSLKVYIEYLSISLTIN
jgi:hypothetical protein